MLARTTWQQLVSSIVMGYVLYIALGILTIIFGFYNCYYINCIFLLLMLLIFLFCIPLNLNYTRKSYKILFLWFFIHILITVFIYAWHYKQSGIIGSDGIVVYSFRDSLYFSITTWTTLGYGDFAPIADMRLVTSIQAMTGLITFPVGFSLAWFMIQESTVPYAQAYLDKDRYDSTGHVKIDETS